MFLSSFPSIVPTRRCRPAANAHTHHKGWITLPIHSPLSLTPTTSLTIFSCLLMFAWSLPSLAVMDLFSAVSFKWVEATFEMKKLILYLDSERAFSEWLVVPLPPPLVTLQLPRSSENDYLPVIFSSRLLSEPTGFVRDRQRVAYLLRLSSRWGNLVYDERDSKLFRWTIGLLSAFRATYYILYWLISASF